MLYSSKYKFVYSKSTKTGSTSVEAALEYLIRGKVSTHGTNSVLYPDGSRIGFRGGKPPRKKDPNYNTPAFSLNHQSLEATRDMIGRENFASSLKISSIRNPYDRFISSFHHFGGNCIEQCITLKQDGKINYIRDAFNRYATEHKSALYTGLEHFYCDSKMVIDEFVRMENIGNDLKAVLERLNVANDISGFILTNIPQYKKTIRAESVLRISDYYTKESLDIVNERFLNWLTLGGYERYDTVDQLERHSAS